MLTHETQGLNDVAVAAIDSTAQAADILSLGAQLRDGLRRVASAALRPLGPADAVVVAGMGGSAVGSRLAWAALGGRARRPLLVVDEYELPPWLGPEALVLCASYSGGTEEALACYDDARSRGARVVVATTGGELAERARCDGVEAIALPTGFQPRAAVGYALVTALAVAELGGAAPPLRAEVEAAADLVDALAVEWGPDGADDGEAKRLARRLDGTVPVITGAGLTAPIAYRWKCQCNENAKVPAFWSLLPEADHNEVCGWEAAREFGRFSAVLLQDPEASPAIARRMALTAELAAEGAVCVELVLARGSRRLERMMSLLLLGDLVSLYLAILRKTDPVEIAAIAKLKRALSER
jgi:glucose/mannose-6-phosphate isomerase